MRRKLNGARRGAHGRSRTPGAAERTGDIGRRAARRAVLKEETPKRHSPSTPSMYAIRMMGPSSMSVVMCVIRARFFTSPHASPSGVSLGQSMPHWLGCSARGPLTLRVFSNCDEMRVIMPSAEMNDNRLRTCVTPARSMRKRFSDQFPVLIARTKPAVMWSP
jgi:hypothetical protein